MRSMRQTCAVCENETYSFKAVLVWILRISIRPCPFSLVTYLGGKILLVKVFDRLFQGSLIPFDGEKNSLLSSLPLGNEHARLVFVTHRQ